MRYEICRTDTQPNPLCAEANVRFTVNAPPVVMPVPTLGEWSALLLGTLTVLGAAAGLRRRKQAGR
ncbi:MAG: IPTL-CTERM sorting domain-containing protein [Ottowia sp.]|nr:IPTL-CTERM sorting domain-containing protein [Ottowia sp.]